MMLINISTSSAAQSIEIQIEDWDKQQVLQLAPKTAYLQALQAFVPDYTTYYLGSFLFRQRTKQDQAARKLSLLHDLRALQLQSRLLGEPALLNFAKKMAAWLARLPSTGRVYAVLDPDILEMTPRDNRTLQMGDHIVLISQPDWIQIVGAVIQPGKVNYQPLRGAALYIGNGNKLVLADRSYLWRILPDGRVGQIPVAAWNHDRYHAVPPGSTLYVPLEKRYVKDINPQFNHQLAEFIATQNFVAE